jgi:NitT/TauT family transport system ATP-binding protein
MSNSISFPSNLSMVDMSSTASLRLAAEANATDAGAPGRAPKIEARGLKKSFMTDAGPLEVLRSIDLDLYQEEIFCLLGPSGCGKSTVLQILAGIIPADAGVAKINSKIINAPGPERAVVFQEDAVFPWLTVRKNVEYGPAARGIGRTRRSELADHYLKITGLEKFASFYPAQLSGGMKKRVDLARAYANQPEVLFMDEAFGSLDVITKEQMQVDLMEMLEKHRMTVLFVTHDIEEALFIGDRVGVMKKKPGRIEEIIVVPFSRPRNRSLRLSHDFQELRGRIYDLILS